MSDTDDDYLPRVHKSEREPSAVDRLEAALRRLDGPMSLSNAVVPLEANDVGGDVRANPRASDLGYPEGYELAVEQDPESGRVIFSDPPNWALAGDVYIHADPEDVIEDITQYA